MASVMYKNTPGVKVEVSAKTNKPIQAVGTSVAAFIGPTRAGDEYTNKPERCNSWSEYVRKFGAPAGSSNGSKAEWTELEHSVYGFFNNGGGSVYIIKIGKKTASKQDYIGVDGGPGNRTGVHAMNDVYDISLVVAPGQHATEVQNAIIDHCERLNRFAILDSKQNPGKFDNIARPVETHHAAFYLPWIKVYDPGAEKTKFVPPSGHIAGIYSRVDSQRGVHKSPANEVIRGALGIDYLITDAEQETLNPKGINCIRDFGDRGIRVWGARTLAGEDNQEWRYIAVKRLFMMIEESLKRGTQWVVFEPNNHELWMRIVRSVTSFLMGVWRSGALFGTTPDQAFYVKCDDETNPPEEIDAGRVNIEIGIAPAKPAEFVVFQLSQWLPEAVDEEEDADDPEPGPSEE